MAKFEGKDGRWITTKTGKHVFIENGKTVAEALGEAFEEFTYDADDEFDSDNNNEDIDINEDILSKFKKHEKESFEESAGIINPGYRKSKEAYINGDNTPEAYERTFNCFKCTVAAYCRIVLGFNVIAKATTRDGNGEKYNGDKDLWENVCLKNNVYRTWTECAFTPESVDKEGYGYGYDIRNSGYKGCKGQKRYLKNLCETYGPGTFIGISVGWAGTRDNKGRYSHHSIYAYNDNGKVKFFDSQTGERCESYWDNNRIKPLETRYIRYNNLEINKDTIEQYVEQGEDLWTKI